MSNPARGVSAHPSFRKKNQTDYKSLSLAQDTFSNYFRRFGTLGIKFMKIVLF